MPSIDYKSTLFIDGTKALREILAVLQIQLDRLVYVYLAHMFFELQLLVIMASGMLVDVHTGDTNNPYIYLRVCSAVRP